MKCTLYLALIWATIVETTKIFHSTRASLNASIGPICVESTLWSLPTFSAAHCQLALQQFLDSDVQTWGQEIFDFMVAGATSRTQFPKVQLPAAYQYDTCTVAVAMLTTIPLEFLLPIPAGTFFPETDRATYEQLGILAQQVKQKCVDNGGDGIGQNSKNFRVTLPGWMTAGSLNAIGIFFLDSRSFMRRQVFGGLRANVTNADGGFSKPFVDRSLARKVIKHYSV